MRKTTRTLAAVTLALTVTIIARQVLLGCAAVPPEGRHVSIIAETAVIIWDADTKTQHFIRRASFDSQADDFGFLVPTPTKPELAVAHDYTFTMLEKMTEPEVITRLRIVKPVRRDGAKMAEPKKDMAGAAPGGVHVLEKKKVGDYDAVILKADDPKALSEWLKKNGYASNKHLTDWLTPYVDQQWLLTAFKISKQAKNRNHLGTSAVRMSFQTDKPFFPYREPADQRDNKNQHHFRRMLRVFFLAVGQMSGTLGKGKAWPGNVVWSGAAPAAKTDFLLYSLGLRDQLKGKTWWLTEFEDASSPRPGTDEVYFSPSAVQRTITRPPIIRYIVHVDERDENTMPADTFWLVIGAVVAACLLVNGFLVWRLLQKTQA